MRRRVGLFALCSSSLLVACVAGSGGSASISSTAPAGASSNDWEGTVVPAEGTPVWIWPEGYSGELILADVLPHGSRVKEGDVVAHIDSRALEEQIRQLEFEVSSAYQRMGNAEEKNRIDRDAAASALEQTRSALDRSRRALEGWEKQELEFAKRRAGIEERHRLAGIDDQTDELAQLEKMYKADELIDATEEIVLKRQRRALDLSETELAFARERRDYDEKIEEPLQTEAKRDAVHAQESALERLVKSQEIETRAADDAYQRIRRQLVETRQKLSQLRHDRDLMTVKAPRDGILLHGSLDDYRPKQAPPRYERGSRIAAHTRIFTVADPDKLAIAIDVPESKLESARSASAVEIRPTFDPKLTASGSLTLEEFPEAKSGPSPENNYAGKIELERAIDGLRPGMRVKVKLAASDASSAPKSAERAKPAAPSATVASP
jgi:multidrug efflux pump subunit AcrA (membrane-fusion protein)